MKYLAPCLALALLATPAMAQSVGEKTGINATLGISPATEDFVKQASVLSPAAKSEREQVFRRRMAEYQQKAGELNREVQEKQKDVLEAFRDKVEAVVAKIAKRNGLQVVIDKGKGGPAIYGAEELDITNQVIEEFNKEYP